MHDVDALFPELSCATRVWLSVSVQKTMTKRLRKRPDSARVFLKKLQQIAIHGFWNFESDVVQPEWSGVFRVGIRSDLFRLIGFYEDASKQNFIVIDSFEKLGQALASPQRDRIDEVARVKHLKLWRRKPRV